jgi:PPOX class probable F420-dependent enzyme
MTTTSPSIAAQVEQLHEGAAAQMPAEALAAFGAEQADLRAAGTPAGTLQPGTGMPDGNLLDVHGQPTTLAAVRGGKPAVVIFYRGGWCPYCNIALRAYEADLLPQLRTRGIELIAVSPQKPDGSLSTRQTNELSFTVVTDPGNQLARVLGILTEPTADAQAAQRTLGLNLADANTDGTPAIPMPTTVIVDAAGIARWVDVHPDYTTRSETTEILEAITNTGIAVSARQVDPHTADSDVVFDPHSLLERSQLGVLATIKSNGRPQLSPVLAFYDRAARVLYVSMTEGRAKTTNLRRDPRAALEVTDLDDHSWATAEGTARLTGPGNDPGGPEVQALVDYYRSTAGEHPDWAQYRRAMVADRRVLMAMDVERVYGQRLG